MRSTLFAFLALFILPLGACNLYFAGGDDPDPCNDYGWAGEPQQPQPEQRNPETGLCESFGWNEPPYPCDGVCGPCWGTVDGTSTDGNSTPPSPGQSEGGAEAPDDSREADQANPSWGYCDSFCSGLDEQSCLGTTGCRGIYDSDGGTGAGSFVDCWQTDFSGPPLVQTCEGLDAYTCSMLDSCIAVHDYACNNTGTPDGLIDPPCEPGYFVACHNEQATGDGCYGDEDCGQGFSCNAADICLSPPGSPCAGDDFCDVPELCYGFCVPDNTDPGQCDGEITCDALPPLCEAGMTPGIGPSGCWTGQCIDLSLCPQASCGDIVGESMCIARNDCSPYYVGVDCSCTPDGCDCAQWNFDRCNPA